MTSNLSVDVFFIFTSVRLLNRKVSLLSVYGWVLLSITRPSNESLLTVTSFKLEEKLQTSVMLSPVCKSVNGNEVHCELLKSSVFPQPKRPSNNNIAIARMLFLINSFKHWASNTVVQTTLARV